MKFRMRSVSRALVVVSLMAGLLVPAGPAQAADVYPVQIGASLEGVHGESMRFLPGRIKVNPGDVLHFTSEGFHTATLLPVGVDADNWTEDYAKDQVADPWATVIPDPDEGPGNFKINSRVAFPSRFDCGTPDAPCSFDGSGDPVNDVLNSGLPVQGPLDFSVTVDAPEGSTFLVICLVHMNMRLRVDVVAAGEESSPDSLSQNVADAVAHDTEEAHALHNKMSAKKTKHRTPSGQVVWDAWAGFDSGHVALFAMYPKRLSIRKGQRVRWHFGNLIFEPHTVTFPLSQGIEIANGLPTPVCDPDGDEGTADDVAPSMPPPVFCEGGPAQLELDIPPGHVPHAGDGAVRGHKDFESSGWRGSNQPSRMPYTLRFPKASGEKPFKYVCVIHPFMRGKVAVR